MKFSSQLNRVALTFLFMLFPVIATAEEINKISYPDTAWILISSALVMLMLPGLALFYGGMVRRKNVLATLIHCFIPLGVITCLLYTSPSPRDRTRSRMPSSA